ncbi:hypothetical protein EVAR_779_1 [Eumeta japonica]|uniref:Uncharacterized protein n=1 Tax=Eumeta variegata TaxID=151549 RepID=A0A4C1SBX8_EUMVA|nr:hypothetical protein EVAR_779_1 [Eumeta japonica]
MRSARVLKRGQRDFRTGDEVDELLTMRRQRDAGAPRQHYAFATRLLLLLAPKDESTVKVGIKRGERRRPLGRGAFQCEVKPGRAP